MCWGFGGRRGRGWTFGDAGEELEVSFEGWPGEGSLMTDAEGGGGGDYEGERR